MTYDLVDSPIGLLRVAGTDAEGLVEIRFLDADGPAPEGWRPDPGAVADAVAQLRAWFRGEQTALTMALRPEGTPFQRRVWAAVAEIPFGRSTSYGDIARRIGQPTASRAVGAANGRNPLPLVVPCHRVIGADGSLTGYGGGLHRKRWLLSHEGLLGPGLPMGVT